MEVAIATGRSAAAQGLNPGCRTFHLKGLPWGKIIKRKETYLISCRHKFMVLVFLTIVTITIQMFMVMLYYSSLYAMKQNMCK
jgi:hypothetical protein